MTRSAAPTADQPNGPLQLKYPTGTQVANPEQRGKPTEAHAVDPGGTRHGTSITDHEACPRRHAGATHGSAIAQEQNDLWGSHTKKQQQMVLTLL